MNFDLSEEQQLIQDSVERFVTDNYALENRQAVVAGKDDFSGEHWATMAELGWLGLLIPEEHGGAELDFVDLVVVLEEMGRGLLPSPFFGHLQGTLALLRAANDPRPSPPSSARSATSPRSGRSGRPSTSSPGTENRSRWSSTSTGAPADW